jgi:hypothetical protein
LFPFVGLSHHAQCQAHIAEFRVIRQGHLDHFFPIHGHLRSHGNNVFRRRVGCRQLIDGTEIFGIMLYTINLVFGCLDFNEYSLIRSGNVLLALYMMRASFALLGNIELLFTCHNAYETRSRLAMPWFTGRWYFGAPIGTKDLHQDTCAPFWDAVLDHVCRDMQYDVRRMANALVGTTTSVRGLVQHLEINSAAKSQSAKLMLECAASPS